MRASIKEDALRLIDSLPEDATWNDLMYAIHVRRSIEDGLADSDADRVIDVEKVKEEFAL